MERDFAMVFIMIPAIVMPMPLGLSHLSTSRYTEDLEWYIYNLLASPTAFLLSLVGVPCSAKRIGLFWWLMYRYPMKRDAGSRVHRFNIYRCLEYGRSLSSYFRHCED